MSESSTASTVPSSFLVRIKYVDDADRSGVDEREQFLRHLTREVARARRELDDQVVDGP